MRLNQSTDYELVERIKKNDEVAFELVFYKYRGKLYDFIRRSLPHEADPENLVQEVFVKIWINRATLDSQQSLNAYLYTIARNEVFGHLRKLMTRKKYLEELHHQITESTETTVRQMEYRELEAIILKLIDELPEKRREIFRESRIEGLSYREISEKLGITENTVDTQIRKALGFLKSKLKNYSFSLFFPFF